MSEKFVLNILLDGRLDGEKKSLNLGELGVFLTAINRALNKAAMTQLKDQAFVYSALSKEPSLLKAEVVSVANGSIWMQVAWDASSFAKENVIQASFLASMLANAAYDLTKILATELRRAANRVGRNTHVDVQRIEPSFAPDELRQPVIRTSSKSGEDAPDEIGNPIQRQVIIKIDDSKNSIEVKVSFADKVDVHLQKLDLR